jgi:SAM-dependent methyltransferase
MTNNNVREKTIKDFDDQWNLQGDLNEDYWASDQILFDQFTDIFFVEEVRNKTIADIGAGTGRVLKTLFKYDPKKVYAVEPSDSGIEQISINMKNHKNLNIIKSDGLKFKIPELCDIIFSLGVIHHIKNPTDVLKNIRNNLKPKGKIVIWVYGYENNVGYILIYKILSLITKKLPNKLLYKFAVLLNVLLLPYIFLCKFINLPLRKYFNEVFSKFGWKKRNDSVFDQLNPSYSKYYKKKEIEKELTDAGFVNLKFNHRHGYSWTVVGENS